MDVEDDENNLDEDPEEEQHKMLRKTLKNILS